MSGLSVAATSTLKLRVGFDGRSLRSPAAGVRRYVRELFGAMAAVDSRLDVIAVGAPADVELPQGVGRIPPPRHLPTNPGWMLTGVPQAVRAAGLDLYHAPAYTAPLWGVRPVVLTIHDVSYARRPEWYPYRRDWLRRAYYRRSALGADLVITDSEFSRREIAEAYGIAAEAIVAIPLGVGEPFATARCRERPAVDAASAPFVLHVGDLHVRRNLGTALAAVLTVRARNDSLRHLQLVLAGTDRGAAAELRARARQAGEPDAVRLVGAPDDGELLRLYCRAVALVYPSRYEGFGLPVLEAMACGLPVVAAQAGATPEVLGGTGVLVDPDDSTAFAEAIERLATAPELARRLGDEARARSLTFSWRRTAEATLDAYQRVGPPRAT